MENDSQIWGDFYDQLKPMLDVIKRIQEQTQKLSANVIGNSVHSELKNSIAKSTRIGSEALSLISPQVTDLSQAFSKIVFPDYLDLAKKLANNQVYFDAWLKEHRFKDIIEILGRETPYNFHEFMLDEQARIVDLGVRFSLGVVECIPAEVLRKILSIDQNHQSVMKTIRESTNEIVELCEQVSEQILEEDSSLSSYANLVHDGIEVLKQGKYSAAQTLFTAILDSFLVAETKSNKPTTQIKRTRMLKSELLAAESLRQMYTHAAYAPAISTFTRDTSDGCYSRHATVHYVTNGQLSTENAVCALTIVTGVLAINWRLKEI